MSDTTKLILGIVIAVVVVVGLIIWLFASARRREAEARRLEAEAVRAQLAERIPVVQERADRASVTARIAEEARREAEAAAAQAARLEQEAAQHRAEAQQVRDEQEQLIRTADQLDPDVRTDADGYRVDEAGRRLPTSAVASALGMEALAQDEDEPDLADHENPFPEYAAATPASSVQDPSQGERAAGARPAPDESSVQKLRQEAGGNPSTEGEGAEDPDWVNSPFDEDAADELEAQAAADAEASDWINGPEAQEEAEPATGTAHSTSRDSSVQNLREEAGGNPSTEGDVDEGAPFDLEEEEAPAGRRISAFEEVVDGGYGVGSAAPIRDGAQPLGHPVMAYRESRTFVAPDAEGYGRTEPDVWFYDEDAARRAGFQPAGGESSAE